MADYSKQRNPKVNCLGTSGVESTREFSVCSRGTDGSILLVEDNADIAHCMSVLLGLKGYCINSVGTGQDALRAMKRLNPDVVILDICLPDMDGIELTKHLRKLSLQDRLLIIAMSGHDKSHWGDALNDETIDGYFIKPANIDELSQRISDFLSRPSATKG